MTAPVTLALYRDAETPLTAVEDMLVTLANDHDFSRRMTLQTPQVTLDLPFHDGPGDAYRIVVHVEGYHDCGGFVHARAGVHQTVSLLLIPRVPTLRFPTWEALQARFPHTAALIAAGVTPDAAATHYSELARSKPLALASLMNLSAAMQLLVIGGGKTPLDFIREVIWDGTLAQDRFFGYADSEILPLVRAAAAEGEFAPEFNPGAFHPGATESYKQTEFDYSNVQLTFHGNDTAVVGGVACVRIEPDMDLFKDPLSHGIAEVIPNLSAHGYTHPLDVLALRWIDAVQSGEPLFDPGYTFA